jgi:hypothetical protein
VFQYMQTLQLQYAFVSCWFRTWLVWRPPHAATTLEVSRPYELDEMHPSVYAALGWLQLEAVVNKEQGQQQQEQPPQQPPPPAGPSGRRGVASSADAAAPAHLADQRQGGARCGHYSCVCNRVIGWSKRLVATCLAQQG